MVDPFHLRRAEPGDRDRILRLLLDCELPGDGVEDHLGTGFVVAEHGSSIIGVAGLEQHGPHGLLRSVAVDPAWRARAVGKALTENRLDWAERAGLKSVYLLTLGAERFFARFGFKRVSRDLAPPTIAASPEFHSLCPATAVLMARECGDRELTSSADRLQARPEP